ncbi:hypothetical protein PC116_g14140 [Phytophthora cactorum]|nr:hypothetical protein Pcac1_g3663 [Phytophthora cactorum]KAG2901854.1 hypothetical protein PC114_g12996 [Phytophthora cactorum]KAG3009012.1 hypothetical protein PC120_g15874 [Phytophthora cactorum]KAG3193289.1 hypothetical protein C6341_g183 [Phytophthora cactorum]KAG3194071.1 hypothetical protein PC128_g9684 [Phytophthora cactorum]
MVNLVGLLAVVVPVPGRCTDSTSGRRVASIGHTNVAARRDAPSPRFRRVASHVPSPHVYCVTVRQVAARCSATHTGPALGTAARSFANGRVLVADPCLDTALPVTASPVRRKTKRLCTALPM